jgi:hypothetical protein
MALSQCLSKQHLRIQRAPVVGFHEVGFDPVFKQSELGGSWVTPHEHGGCKK